MTCLPQKEQCTQKRGEERILGEESVRDNMPNKV